MPSMENLSPLTGLDSKPMAPSRVPAGQIYLQKAGRGKRAQGVGQGKGHHEQGQDHVLEPAQGSGKASLAQLGGGQLMHPFLDESQGGHSQPQMTRPQGITPTP